MRKGQATLYILMGILLLIILGLTIYIFSLTSEIRTSDSFDTSDIEFMITECMKKTGREGLNLLGNNGNYIEIPGPLRFQGTSYWIVEYANVQPIFNSSADDFQLWFNEKFAECVDFSDFSYSIEAGSCNSSINYGAEDVIITINYPVNITLGEKTKTLDIFQETLNLRYRRAYERAREIINAHYLQSFDYRDALKNVDKRNFNISYRVIDKDNLVFTITDFVEPDSSSNFVFTFATNIKQSSLKRTVDVDGPALRFFYPLVVYSPDRMAFLTLSSDVSVNTEEISTWADYSNVATRKNVTKTVSYRIDQGDIIPGPKTYDDINWNLTYPIYSFTPNSTNFSYPQRLTIFWDDDKLPNYGPVGLLYKGERSKYKWTPISSRADYNNSFLYVDINGFSEYTVVDCARQPCREVSVTSHNKTPKKGFFSGALGKIFKIVLAVAIVVLIVFTGPLVGALLSGAGSATTVGVVGTSLSYTGLGYVVGGIAVNVALIAAAGSMMMMGDVAETTFTDSTTTVTMTPICDQIVDVSCIPAGGFSSGYGMLNNVKIEPGAIKEVTVSGGTPQTLTAVATKCRKGKKCSLTCKVLYK